MDSSILDTSLLVSRTARDSMVSEGPLATDASFARKAFDCGMSEDMLGARSVSLMVSTPSVTHKKNWLQKQLSSAKKAILRGRSKRSSVISTAEGAGELTTTPSVKLWAAASSTLDESALHEGMTQPRTVCAFLKHQSRSKPSLYRLPSTWGTIASLSLARCAVLVYDCKCVRLMCCCSCIGRWRWTLTRLSQRRLLSFSSLSSKMGQCECR
jgi:hypothetical protein